MCFSFAATLRDRPLHNFLVRGLRVFVFFVIVVCPVTHTKQKLLGLGLLVSRFSVLASKLGETMYRVPILELLMTHG